MIRKILLLLVLSVVNVCYAQKKAQCDMVISISMERNLMLGDSIDFWIETLDVIEHDISKNRFKSKKKLQSLRHLIRSLELVRDSTVCNPQEGKLASLEKFLVQSPEVLNDINSGLALTSLTLPQLNSKHAQFIKAIVARNEQLQNIQMDILRDITNVNLKTKENLESLMQCFIINQNRLFEAERDWQYQQRMQECKNKLYLNKHQVKHAIDEIKLNYSKAYRRSLN